MTNTDKAIHNIGQTVEVVQDENDNAVLRNAQTGTEIALGDVVDIIGGLGADGDAISGTSYFEAVDTAAATIQNTVGRFEIDDDDGDQEISPNTLTKVQFSEERFESEIDGFDGENHKWVVPADGRYYIDVNLEIRDVTDSSIEVDVRIEEDGSFRNGLRYTIDASQRSVYASVSGFYSEGTEFEIYVEHDDSDSIDVFRGSNRTSLQVVKVG